MIDPIKDSTLCIAIKLFAIIMIISIPLAIICTAIFR